MIRFLLLVAASFLSTSTITFAQTEVERERSSLRGVSELGVVINIEKPGSVDTQGLNASQIKSSIEQLLSGTDIRLLSDRELRESDKYPILYVHVNLMKAASNLYPFSIEQSFYQPVKLMLQNDLQTTAATWNKGTVGVVSADNFALIAEEAVYMSRLFVDEFKQVNQ